jgi:ribosomal protein S18 acetylase RimI-like enzyme
MRREIEHDIAWLRVLDDGRLCAFASAGPAAPKEFKLHKLYVHPDRQREGIGAALLARVESIVRTRGADHLILNVNKNNEKAIAVYHRHGFAIRESVVVDIGGGFVMDDYVMVKPLTAAT